MDTLRKITGPLPPKHGRAERRRRPQLPDKHKRATAPSDGRDNPTALKPMAGLAMDKNMLKWGQP